MRVAFEERWEPGIDICRRMTPQQRLQTSFDLSELHRVLVRLTVRYQYPEWSEPQVQAEARRRLLIEAGLPEVHPCLRTNNPVQKTP
jgi:hypothetical protein